MDNAAGVSQSERVRRVHHHAHHFLERIATACATDVQLLESHPQEELHRHVEHVALDSAVEDTYDPGMLETGSCPCLSKKSVPEQGVRLRFQNLHRGLTVKEAVPGLKDARLGTLADATAEQIVTYDCALFHRLPSVASLLLDVSSVAEPPGWPGVRRSGSWPPRVTGRRSGA